MAAVPEEPTQKFSVAWIHGISPRNYQLTSVPNVSHLSCQRRHDNNGGKIPHIKAIANFFIILPVVRDLLEQWARNKIKKDDRLEKIVLTK